MKTAKAIPNWIFLMAVFSVLGVFGMVSRASASSSYPGIYNSYFGTTPICSLCHTSSIPDLNATGTAFSNAGGNTIAGWTAIKPADPTPPTVTITTPTGSPTYTASSSSLSIGGTASDNFSGPFGVTQVTWSNSLGGAGTCSGTTSWSASGVTLSNGQNVITVAARDEAGNTGTGTLTVTYTPTPTPTPVLTTINVTPSSASISQSSTQQFKAEARDQNNNPMSVTFTWSSSDTAVATVNASSGMATGVATGSATITATSAGVSGTASLAVTASAPSPTPTPVLTSITVAPATASIAAGATQQFTATALDQNNNPMSAMLTWSSSNTAVATIDSSSGLATGLNAGGPVTITATSGTISGAAFLSVTVASPQPSPPIPGTADLSIWVGKWFKVKIQNQGYYNREENRLSNDRESLSAYLKVTAWDPDNNVLQATILGEGKDEEGKWSEPISLHYISGTSLKFLCWSQMTLAGDANYGFAARIKGKMRGGDLVGGSFTTVAGYHVGETTEDDDGGDDGEEASSKQPLAGWFKVTGKLIADEEVSADIKE